MKGKEGGEDAKTNKVERWRRLKDKEGGEIIRWRRLKDKEGGED